MEIIVAKSAGFCFGVDKAINTVYNELEKEKLYTYGPLIHNKEVIEDLEQKGANIINSIDDIEQERTVIIRSHGVSKQLYKDLETKNIRYIDCTCPFVKKIHNIVKENYKAGNTIVIIGDKAHPEVIGINGWCDNTAIIIQSTQEAKDLELRNNYAVVSQTTFSTQKFETIINILKSKKIHFKLYNTICNATSNRQSEAVELAKKADKMLIIGDKKSSNTQKLYDICSSICKKSYYIETIDDLELNIFRTNDRIGITAGASTPSAIIKEVIKVMSELNQINDESNQTFEQMLNESFVTLHTGDIVKGTVIQVTNEEVSVNLGYKSDGIIEKNEFSNNPHLKPSEVVKPGDEIEVFVVRVNDGEGNVLLSRKRIEAQKGLNIIEKAYENKEIVKGKIVEIVKGGMIANIEGIRVFVPSSQISNKYVEDLKSLIGKEYDFNIIEFNKYKRKVVAGRKELANKKLEQKKQDTLDKLSIGQIVEGTVSRITDFGAFIDLGGVDGLVHISEMSWGRINKPQDILKQGQKVNVTILNIDKDNCKISLTLKNADNDPWKDVEQKYAVNSIVDGKIVRMLPFGAFVELEEGIDGLIHISQISDKHIAKPEDVLSIGDTIKVKILDINTESKKISLSKKEADGKIDENIQPSQQTENDEQ